MSYGLRSYAADGKLLIDYQMPCMHFVGAASFYAGSGDGVSTEAFSLYRITSTIHPMVALRITNGNAACVGRVYNVGSNTWEIEVAGTVSAVLCFSEVGTQGANANYGARSFDASGNVMFDTTRLPLWVGEVHSITGASASSPNVVTLPSAITLAQSYSNPAIVAYAMGNHFRSIGAGGNPGTIDNDIRRFGWQRTSTGYTPVWIQTASGQYEAVTATYDHHCSGFASHSVAVIESNGY
jgi:hypothetical protein